MMVSRQENELLTQVGPGTPGGELMRKYWHPVCAAEELLENPVRAVRILAENFVVYRDGSGGLGMLDARCPHRLVSLALGVPEENGLRCSYHGWLFDNRGRCLEMPLEPPNTALRERAAVKSYPVEELGGLVWAYIGSDSPPLLPKWNWLARKGGFRQIIGHRLPCNWLQVMENRGDLGHAFYLHGRTFRYVLERQGRSSEDPDAIYNVLWRQHEKQQESGAYTKYRPVYNDYGFTKGEMPSDADENAASWQVGSNPILFPYLVLFGPFDGAIRQEYQMGVPIDDTHTWHIDYMYYDFPEAAGAPEQECVPYVEAPIRDENGEYIRDYILAQDMAVWDSQGDVAERWNEHLGVSDRDVIAYRRLLMDQIEKVQAGEEPINRFWDVASADSPDLRIPGFEGNSRDRWSSLKDEAEANTITRQNIHKMSMAGRPYLDDEVDRVTKDRDLLLELFQKTADLRQSKD
jgi:5,5'-dehydrodivanillate O-demethylase